MIDRNPDRVATRRLAGTQGSRRAATLGSVRQPLRGIWLLASEYLAQLNSLIADEVKVRHYLVISQLS